MEHMEKYILKTYCYDFLLFSLNRLCNRSKICFRFCSREYTRNAYRHYSRSEALAKDGSGGRDRTYDQSLNRRPLYR
ncbi:MAG: hypothetical protein UU82_C0017G0001 [Candidatus Nomurabacteria bacterium GW2011_GWC2_41_8]|uniref:Uncharacterized protein n=1 Tax=Candidatus Nomurabacteria bacterium GW2011_GWC2_41_8 TaxID=1618755 RepID=A0A0G0XHE0_9BACT|nr:MAG: hypothetical protein UU82_C0017G0001 [Candidatus Nomurabacteria bacterium GW2011_GWC2_41_8]